MVTRREALATGVGALGAALLGATADAANAATPDVASGTQGAAPSSAPPPPAQPPTFSDGRALGAPTRAIGARDVHADALRTPTGDTAGSSLTPLEKLTGTITPSDLHFERHHAGVPTLDPATHTLTLHGLVDRPLVFTLAELQRLPQVTRTYFIECSGNSRNAYRAPEPTMTAQRVAGLFSNSEWTGVRLATLFAQVGVQRNATWFLAEGADPCLMARSIPIAKGWEDALVVWAQNGEPLRPEQGYPLRLLLPGWEGNTSIKWLRRLEFGTAPWQTRWETSKYTDPLVDGTARQFSFDIDAKSLITSPSHPTVLGAQGWYPISGLAWSGRGRITKVEVSTDNGRTWQRAELHGEPQPKAAVRFQHMWQFTGSESVLLSRATDETDYVQPTRAQLIAVRGLGTDFHFNHIVGWRVDAAGAVTFAGASE
ncbi:MAG: sulfite dehydrogenase [Gemmatimonadetes bacterium]|nr:sulfite dehydrogenase [Gemmatimonadota bacterium]